MVGICDLVRGYSGCEGSERAMKLRGSDAHANVLARTVSCSHVSAQLQHSFITGTGSMGFRWSLMALKKRLLNIKWCLSGLTFST